MIGRIFHFLCVRACVCACLLHVRAWARSQGSERGEFMVIAFSSADKASRAVSTASETMRDKFSALFAERLEKCCNGSRLRSIRPTGKGTDGPVRSGCIEKPKREQKRERLCWPELDRGSSTWSYLRPYRDDDAADVARVFCASSGRNSSQGKAVGAK